MEAPVSYSTPVSYPWYEVWQKVYLHPSVQSFLDILSDPMAKANRAYIWVAIAGAISGLVNGIAQTVSTGNFLSLLCGAALSPVFAVIGLAIGSAITHAVAGLFGGRGTYDRMAYALGAISAPATLISIIFTVVMLATGMLGGAVSGDPSAAMSGLGLAGLCILPFSLAWGIYTIVLQVNAIKAVEGVGTGAALLTIFLPGIVIAILIGICFALGFGAILAGVMSNQ